MKELPGHRSVVFSCVESYFDPLLWRVECECGENLSSMAQYYWEPLPWEQDWLDHLAEVEFGIDPTPIYEDLEADYQYKSEKLKRKLAQFMSIDCGIPGH